MKVHPLNSVFVFYFFIVFIIFVKPSFAAGWINITNKYVGQKTTITLSLKGQNCFLDKNGQPTDQTFNITRIKVLASNANGGVSPVIFSGSNVSVNKNGEQITGTYDQMGYFNSSTPFTYTKDDTVSLIISNAQIISPSRAYFYLALEQNQNQCINSGNIYFQFLPVAETTTPTPTITPTNSPVVSPQISIIETKPKTNTTSENIFVKIKNEFSAFIKSLFKL